MSWNHFGQITLDDFGPDWDETEEHDEEPWTPHDCHDCVYVAIAR